MRNLLVINYRMDSADQVLSHQQGVINGLGQYFEKVIVLTGYYDGGPLAENIIVYSTSWNSNHKLRSIFKFYRGLASVFASYEISSVFSHMASYRALLASPFVWAKHINHSLWYAHATYSSHLKVLSCFGVFFISSTPESFPSKLRQRVSFIGQGINPKDFPFTSRRKYPMVKFVHVGRFDVSKRVGFLISSLGVFRAKNPDITFANFGFPSTIANSVYADDIRRGLANETDSNWVSFSDAVSRTDIPHTLNEFDVFIHAFQGSLDKVLVEATLTGIPVITLNSGYCRIFGTWGEYANGEVNLIEEIQAFSRKTDRQISLKLEQSRDIALKEHSENQWLLKLVQIILGNGVLE